MTVNLGVQYEGSGTAAADPSIWLNLQQEPIPEIMRALSFLEIEEMFYAALSGLSSRVYESDACPLTVNKGEVIVWINLFVWPHRMDMNYGLSAAIGEISDPERLTRPREFDLLFPMTSERELDFLIDQEDPPVFSWQTPAYDEQGRVIPHPGITVSGNKVKLSRTAFGSVRVKCRALGYGYTVVMRLEKFKEEADPDAPLGSPPNMTGYKIENLANSITATWRGADGSAQSKILKLEIPKCVESYLATCPDGELKSALCINYLGDDPVDIYYDGCNGRRLTT